MTHHPSKALSKYHCLSGLIRLPRLHLPVEQNTKFIWFSLIVGMSARGIMEPPENKHIEHDRRASRQCESFNSPDRKYSQIYSDGRFANYTHKPFLTFHSPPNLCCLYDHYGEPRGTSGAEELHCCWGKITRKQHYNRDVNMRRVNLTRLPDL